MLVYRGDTGVPEMKDSGMEREGWESVSGLGVELSSRTCLVFVGSWVPPLAPHKEKVCKQ